MGLCKKVRLQFAENTKLDLSIRSIYFVVLKENPVSDPSNQYVPSWVLCFIVFFVSRVVCQKEKIESADYYKLYAFEFNDFDLTDDETILSSLRIMFELGFMNAVHAKLEVNSETRFFYRRCMYVYWCWMPGGYSQKNWIGVCGPLPKTLTLFMTKIWDFPYPIYYLTKNLIPYL